MTMSTTKLHIDSFDSGERNEQLEIIDKLRELGVGDDISLPQVSKVVSSYDIVPVD